MVICAVVLVPIGVDGLGAIGPRVVVLVVEIISIHIRAGTALESNSNIGEPKVLEVSGESIAWEVSSETIVWVLSGESVVLEVSKESIVREISRESIVREVS